MVRGDAVRSFTLMFLQMWDIDTRADVYDRYLISASRWLKKLPDM